jgi:hypothetical protein
MAAAQQTTWVGDRETYPHRDLCNRTRASANREQAVLLRNSLFAFGATHARYSQSRPKVTTALDHLIAQVKLQFGAFRVSKDEPTIDERLLPPRVERAICSDSLREQP